MPSDISNQKAVKFLSAEFALSFVISATLVGIAWGTLASAQAAQGQEIVELKETQDDMKTAIDEINSSVATIKANQANQSERAAETREQQQRMEDKLDRLTERLLSND